MIADRIRVSVVGLAAQVAICAELCARTNSSTTTPSPAVSSPDNYSVALHEQHFRELFLAATTPPPTLASEQHNASLLMMGFPSRTLASKDHVSLCACHNRPSREGYACTRCRAKVCRLPAECPCCGLTLILSTHLARSYHHLFPLKGWVEVSWAEAAAALAEKGAAGCFACLARFPDIPPGAAKGKGKGKGALAKGDKQAGGGEKGGVVAAEAVKGVSESGRYKCQVCGNHFCIDCDVFAHEIIHNCPGCQSDTRGMALAEGGGNGNENGKVNGQGNGVGEAMAVDS